MHFCHAADGHFGLGKLLQTLLCQSLSMFTVRNQISDCKEKIATARSQHARTLSGRRTLLKAWAATSNFARSFWNAGAEWMCSMSHRPMLMRTASGLLPESLQAQLKACSSGKPKCNTRSGSQPNTHQPSSTAVTLRTKGAQKNEALIPPGNVYSKSLCPVITSMSPALQPIRIPPPLLKLSGVLHVEGSGMYRLAI